MILKTRIISQSEKNKRQIILQSYRNKISCKRFQWRMEIIFKISMRFSLLKPTKSYNKYCTISIKIKSNAVNEAIPPKLGMPFAVNKSKQT